MKYSKRNAVIILVLGITIGIIVSIVNKSSMECNMVQIKRPDYGEEASQYDLKIQDEDSERVLPIIISPRVYSENEIMQRFQEVESMIPALICGNNESLQSVRETLNLVTSIQGEAIEIQWYSSDYSLVNFNGEVFNKYFEQDEFQECSLKAVLTYETYEHTLDLDIKVLAPERTKEEQFRIQLEKQLVQANEEGRELDTVELPEMVDGREVTYFKIEETISAIIFPLLAAVFVAALYIGGLEENRKKSQERNKQLRYDYSEMVLKLTLLIGAGMTFRKAWEKIVLDYEKTLISKKRRYVYEEMRETLYQMQAGVSEQQAYEQFGKRCNTKEYIKLASLLQQNLKKGSRGLSKMLEEEAVDSFEQRKNLAIQKGEEAGTKLLVPMMIMLVVVMIIIMVPAMMSFQG